MLTSAESLLGAVLGFVSAVGGLAGCLWAALALFRWATRDVKPRDPRLDDEDEIDHRFY